MMFGRLRSWVRPKRTPPSDTRAAPGPSPVEVAAERSAVRLPGLTHEARREMIAALGQRAGSLGCIVFEGDPALTAAVVIFAGNGERFHMLSAAARVACKVVYLQDLASGWYQGSAVLPDLPAICQGFLARELEGRTALFFGQSSGAYAALVASTYFPGATVVACAPQTRPDAAAKGTIHFVGVRPLPTPDDILDVRARLIDVADATASTTVVIAVSEADNPVHFHFWMDYLHALHVWDVPNIRVSVVNSNGHAIVHGNVQAYAELLDQLTAELDAPVERRNAITRAFLERTYAPPVTPPA